MRTTDFLGNECLPGDLGVKIPNSGRYASDFLPCRVDKITNIGVWIIGDGESRGGYINMSKFLNIDALERKWKRQVEHAQQIIYAKHAQSGDDNYDNGVVEALDEMTEILNLTK